MPDYYEELLAAQKEAEAAFGATFHLNGDYTRVFIGVFSYVDNMGAIGLGDLNLDVTAQCEAHLAQFQNAGLLPAPGMTTAFGAGVFRIVRVNRRENSLELLLRDV